MRTRSCIRAIALAGLLSAALAAPASAQMSVAVKVFQDFATDGVVDPCKHTSEELRKVQQNIPPDIEQYAPDYPAAIAAALEARARGDCAGKKPQAPAPVATVAPTPIPTPVPTAVPMKTVVPEPPSPEPSPAPSATPKPTVKADVALERVATARPANDAPAPVLLMAVLGSLLATFALFLFCMRRFGWGEERLAGPLHAWREASWRAGGVWQEFRDWLRTGR